MSDYALALVAITTLAAVVNGALGYGFSSLTVPTALLFLTNRVLNPALVLIEVVLNGYALWINRASLPLVWRAVLPVVIGLAPGVIIGTAIVAAVSPGGIKLATFVVLLPLILLQAAGYRRPVRSWKTVGFAFGTGVGTLYAVTTISGPPLAVALNNQGFTKQQFRAAIGCIRLIEAGITAAVYAVAGLFATESLLLIPNLVIGVVVGLPIGAWLIRRVPVETFRRVCMSFDAWVVGLGISTLLRALAIVESGAAYLVLVAVILVDLWLLYRFFSQARAPGGVLSGAVPTERLPLCSPSRFLYDKRS